MIAVSVTTAAMNAHAASSAAALSSIYCAFLGESSAMISSSFLMIEWVM